MFGMTMFDRNVPNFWTWTRVDVRSRVSVPVSVLVDMCFALPSCGGRVTHVTYLVVAVSNLAVPMSRVRG
jgi:hypothetical protein